ncbi:MAG TPA: hypothetical protein VFB45_23660 [Pseudolabrys sp.]|nr:hypothetical protein [Pseudolabrys sp.]
MRKASWILVLSSLLSSSAALASNWTKMPDLNVDGGTASIDTETFTFDHDVVTFWEKVEYPDGSIERVRFSIDCGKRTWQALYGLNTDAHGMKKEEVATPEPVKDIPPDTIVDVMRYEVCMVPAIADHLPKRPNIRH